MEEYLDYVHKGFRILHPFMAAYIAKEMEREYGNAWWRKVLESLSENSWELPGSGDWSILVDSLDIANCLRLLDRRWNDVFRKRLNLNCRTWSKELMGVRNDVAHAGPAGMSKDDAERALDTMARLCRNFDEESAEEINAMLRELRYGTSMGSTSVTEATAVSAPAEPPQRTERNASGLPSWREIIEPHPDVAQGRYLNAEFAADLAQVAAGEGAYEYRDPVEFFARTYVTEGMKGLLVQALKRFGGKDGEPVLQLKTSFGGGKTHSLLALYHMSRGNVPLNKIPNLESLMREAGFDTLPNAKVAVLVGTAMDPTKIQRPNFFPGITIHTMWGEMAAQLAMAADDPSLYDYVKEADKKGVSPGSRALKELFDACGPCLVLMDELVAYAKKIYGVSGLPAGSFDNFISFIQEITEAASASKNSMVVASIPESAIEIGGDAGQKALETIEHTFGRKESIWKPVAANEGFEVVRRRLFLNCKDPQKRDQVCSAFSQMYQENANDFPVEVKEVDYRNRMISCYPIHPEIFDRLYEEWATMEHFQRTRGVLRLMAAVIHELWIKGDTSSMILPGSLPLDVPSVKDELVRYLPEAWNSIIDTEVDGKNSLPYKLDKENVRYGSLMAARRIARTILLGSAPTVRGQSIRGIELSWIRLGTIRPNENISTFNDALNTLRGLLSYFYSNQAGNRYWYDTRPTLNKTASDRMTQIPNSETEYEIEKRLKKLRKEAPFTGMHICPSSSSEISDEQSVRLVILGPECGYNPNKPDCAAVKKSEEFLNMRGSSPRTYRNMLLFIAPDQSNLSALKASVSELLAWESIKRDSVALNLDAMQNTETDNNISRCSETVNNRLNETYCWLLTPFIDKESDIKTVNWESNKLNGTESIPLKAAKTAIQNEQIITKWAPALLKLELDSLLWKDADHIQVKKLWEYLTTYCYLPRLSDYSVLQDVISKGVQNGECFAIASSLGDDQYDGLKYQASIQDVYPSDYLVKIQPALMQLIKQKDNTPSSQGGNLPGPNVLKDVPATNTLIPSPRDPADGSEKPDAQNNHFYMSVTLDNTRVIRDLQTYLEEVISHLSSLDACSVKLSLDVSAQTEDGFPQDIVRTVSENCRTLHVDNFGFEK